MKSVYVVIGHHQCANLAQVGGYTTYGTGFSVDSSRVLPLCTNWMPIRERNAMGICGSKKSVGQAAGIDVRYDLAVSVRIAVWFCRPIFRIDINDRNKAVITIARARIKPLTVGTDRQFCTTAPLFRQLYRLNNLVESL